VCDLDICVTVTRARDCSVIHLPDLCQYPSTMDVDERASHDEQSRDTRHLSPASGHMQV
jgi:hypothetical protein